MFKSQCYCLLPKTVSIFLIDRKLYINDRCKFNGLPYIKKSCKEDVILSRFRNTRPDVFCKKGVLRNFAKITGKHLCPSVFFNKVAGLRPASFLKKRLWHRCFPVNFVNFLRTPFLIEHLWWLLLHLSEHVN